MAGLLDFLNSDDAQLGLGLLAASAPMSQPMNFAGRLGMVGQQLQAQKHAKLQEEMIRSQIAENASQADQRKQQVLKQQQLADMVGGLFGGGGVMAPQVSPGAFAPSPGAAGGYGPTMPPSMATQAMPGSRLANLGIDQIAGLKALGGPDLLDAYKWVHDPLKMEQGSTYMDRSTGKERYMPKVGEGIAADANGFYSDLPGYGAAQARIEGAKALATETPKALLGAAGKVNLRKNADGTETPVSELTENPTLQNVLGVTPPAAKSRPMLGKGEPRALVEGTNDLRSTITGLEATLADAKPGSDLYARTATDIKNAKAELARMGGAPSYGMTTDEAAAAEAKKTKAVEQVKADTMSTAGRQNAIASANYLNSVLNMAMDHPGLKTATGLSGTLDPRNYLPGTDAKNFHSVLDQVKGAGFLQAFESLKGGGAITEMEGGKATNAIARLNTAQSSDEFKKALGDMQTVVQNGLTRAKNNMKASTGAEGSFAGDNSDVGDQTKRHVFNDLPKTAPKGQRVRDTATGKILKFDGMAWKEEK